MSTLKVLYIQLNYLTPIKNCTLYFSPLSLSHSHPFLFPLSCPFGFLTHSHSHPFPHWYTTSLSLRLVTDGMAHTINFGS